MPALPHPLRAIRSSRWRRLALGAVLAGVLAGPVAAPPAEAEGDGPHFVTISGWVKIDSNRDHCVATYNKQITLQRGRTEEKQIDINNDCGRSTATVRLLARLRSDRYVHTEGMIRLKSRACFFVEIGCTTVTDSRPYRADIPDNFTQDMPHTEKLQVARTDLAADAEFDFDIITRVP